jgi:glycosyltransferase involved in cell wall biosynthesis
LVPVKDPVALAEAIRKLVFDPDLRQRMGAQGRKLVEDQFSEQIVVGKTLALYRSLFANR